MIIDPPISDRDIVYGALCMAFGSTVYTWPDIRDPIAYAIGEGSLQAVREVGLGLYLPVALDRSRFEFQAAIGQAEDDAGGFAWRCWQAALGWRVRYEAAL